MKSKDKPGSKISTTSIKMSKKNTNRKKTDNAAGGTTFDKVFYKKNEFTLILLGAFLLTIIVFFVFFRTSGNEPESVENNSSDTSFATLEKRIEALEISSKIAKTTKESDSVQDKKNTGSNPLEQRIARLETTVLIKFESLVERMDSLEKNIETLKNKTMVSKPAVVKSSATVRPAKIPVKKIAKTAVKKKKKASMFHTVQKKETLYSISKKYKTTVSALKKLNNLSEKDKIYPGDNIIIK